LQGSQGGKFARLHESFFACCIAPWTGGMLHAACIVGFNINYKQRQKVTFKLANTINVF